MEDSGGNPNVGYALFLFVVLPFWTIYFAALFLTIGRIRAAVSLFGVAVLSSCVSWIASTESSQEETPEHAIIANARHRPHLWSTLLLTALAVVAIAVLRRRWVENGGRDRYRTAIVILPLLAACIPYIWTMVVYYGWAALLQP